MLWVSKYIVSITEKTFHKKEFPFLGWITDPLARVNMNVNVTMFFVTIFSLVSMEKKNLRKVDSSYTKVTENVNNRYTTTAGKAASKKCNPLFFITE